MKNSKSNSKKNRKRTVNIKKILAVFFVIIVAFLAIYITKKNNKNESFKITPEIARSKEYDVVQAGDEKTNSDYVLFDAFFLKDLDGDGKADSIRGTCNEIGKQDTLYMDLKVINNGHFKDGVITINSSNFNLATTLVRDQIIAQNYISENTKTIKLKDIQNGNQKLITGIVKANIGNDTTKYSKINSVTLTGTHVADDGTETKINKTINCTVDWYGTTTAKIYTTNINENVDSMDQLLNGENVKLDFEIRTQETDNELILKSSNIEGTIPELNGYKPISVKITGENVTFDYDQETGHFTAKREAILNENGVVTTKASAIEYTSSKLNSYMVSVIYPKEAYDNMEDEVIELMIPVKTYYEGYNNTNDEFQNPYVSNTAEATIVARWTKTEGYVYRFDIKVGKYSTSPYARYSISKEKPLKIYNNISEEESKDYYKVRWIILRGSQGNDESVIMKETKNNATQVSDSFIKTDSSTESMENLTSNVGVYLTGAEAMFGTDGWVKIYNDTTNELLVTFNKDNWNKYNENNPYYYENSAKHIRVETSAAQKNTQFSVFSIKELDDKYITENYEKEVFDKFQYIKSNLNGYYGTNLSTTTNRANYEAPTSIAKIEILKANISTQETTENQVITITALDEGYNTQKWKNGTFLVKLPKEITSMDINSVTIDNNDVSVLGYDLYEQDDCYFIKILTENEKESTYKININCNMTPDPRNKTTSKKVELYAINESAVEYYFKENDGYDVDGDSNLNEIINYTTANISLISPNELLTNQIASKYDNENNVTIAPRVAKVEKQQRTAEIQINITNSYAQEITDVVIQGVIPFKDNEFIVGNNKLGSTFSTWMSNTGIKVPEELKDYVTIYYSTEEKPTNDLTNEANKWKKAEEVTNWKDIKTYIIDLGEYKLQNGESHKFTYEVNLPEGVNYNEVSYSEHGIYFSILTDAGKYSTFTAANKLGLMIAKQYDLEIEKYQKDTSKKIQGITFSITEEGKGDSKIRVTNANGILSVNGLYAEKTYIIKEIRATDDYVLNSEEIKLYTYTDEDDKLYVKFKNEDGTYSNLESKYNWIKSAESIKNSNEEYKVKLQIENEPKLKLKVVKKNGEQKLSGVRFKLTGKEKDSILSTDSKGELLASGLYLNETYTLQETKATGYYLPNNPITFKVNNNSEIEISGDGIVNSSVTKKDELPTLNIELENEKIPEYRLKITKKETDTDTTLKGTQFKLTGEDKNENIIYETDENGNIEINNLYEYVNGKNIEAKYTLTEISPTEGYILNKTPLVFKAERNASNELEFKVESGSIRGDAEIDSTNPSNPIINITLDNNPIFTLTKLDEDTNKPLKDVEFKITDMNNNTITDVNGNDLSNVKTDENGKLRLSLGQGLYKAIETKQLPGYEEPTLYTGIGIGESKPAKTELRFDKENNELELYEFMDITNVPNGFIGVGYDGKVVKFDNAGNIVWINNEKSYSYNGVANIGDGIIAVGYKGIVAKYDFDGNVIWENIEKYSYYKDIAVTDDGVIVASYNGEVVKYSFDGNIVWLNKEKDYSYNAITAVEDGVIAVGNSGKVVKYGLDGTIIWENTSKYYKYEDVVKIEDGILATGYNGVIEKYDFDGNIIKEIKKNSYVYNSVIYINDEIICVGENGKVVKYNLNGDIVWENGTLSNCNFVGLINVEDGIVAISSNGQLIKYNYNGEIIWKNTDKSYNYQGLVKVSDGVIAVSYNGQVVKYDFDKNIIWKNTEKMYKYMKVALVENGVVAVGDGGQVVKYDFNGNCIWQNTDKTYTYQDITSLNDGVVVVDNRGHIVKYDLEGNFVFEKKPNSYYYNGVTTVADGIIAVGRDGKVVKFDFEGNLVWENLDMTYNFFDITTIEDGIIVIGLQSVVKLDLDGNIIWKKSINKYYYSVTKTKDGVVGATDSGELTTYSLDGEIISDNAERKYKFKEIVTLDNGIAGITRDTGIVFYKNAIVDPEIPEAQSAVVKNKKKRVKITTEVKGSGGTISGQDDSPYEEVIYDNNSVKEIKAVPESGYKVVKITVNDKEIDFSENADGTVTLSKFIEMKEDKHVVVEFSNSVSSIEVNHYLWKEDTGVTTTKVADSSTKNGNINDSYTTEPRFDIEYEIVTNKDFYGNLTSESQVITKTGKTLAELGYTEITDQNDPNYGKSPLQQFLEDSYIPTNASGKYTDTTQVVDYYYKEKTYTLTIKHLLEGTEQNVPSKTGELVEDEITEGLKKDENYTTEQSNKIDYTKYELIDKSDNYKGKIEDDTEVRYYYRLKDSAGVIVHHYIVGTENKVPSNSDGVVEDEILPSNGTAKVGDDYETSNASSRIAQNYKVATNKDVYGNIMPQELVGKETEVYTPTNATGKYKENVQEVTYYYVLETPEYTNTISKTGTENIVKEDEKVIYNITYNVQVQDYIGNATVQIVDNLPYKIDVSKSSLNGGEYNETNKTITWKDMIRNIDTYNNPSSGNIAISKAISVVYKNLDYSKNVMTNRVSGSTKLLSSNVTTDVVQAEANTNYHFYRDITLNKVWQDNDDSLGLRPESINVTLKATIEGENSTQVEYSIPNTIQKNVTLKNTTGETNGENWTYKWQNLDKYSSEGKLINYTIEENLEGNLANVYSGTLEEQNNVFTLTNKYEEPTEKIDLIVNKIWEDNNNENEKRPSEIKIVVSKPKATGEGVDKVQEYLLNTATETSHTFTNLLKYDEKGNKINYVVEEDEVNENDLQFYNSLIGNIEEKEIGGKQVYETTITNSFQVSDEKVNVVVTKEWEDINNENEKRPDKIKIVVSKPKTTGEGVDIVEEYTLNTATETSHTFENLTKYNEKGNEITYTITEEEVNEGDLKFYTKQIEEDSKNNFKITNTFTVPGEQISITAKKVWDDDENVAEKRPASVTIKLMNGSQEVATDIANLENNWQVTFSNLAKYDSKGKEIDYKVKEQETNQNDLHFYKSSVITGNKEDGFEIKNTFEVPDDKIQIPVTKTWNDENKDRIEKVVLVLEGNGKTYTQTITSSNKFSSNSNIWNYTFKNLPKYDSNGNEITYKLSEKEANKGDLNKYITTIDGYNATNTLIVKDTKIEKEGTEKITSLDDKIVYSLKYTISLNEEYKDEAKITIIDTLPYEIDTSKEYNLDGGVYDSKKKTITWTSPYNNEMAITKNISLVYKNIDVSKTKITNNVKGIFELENGYKEEKTASFDTKTDFTTSVEVNKVWVGDSKTNSDGTLTISSSRPNKATIELNTLNENNKLTQIDKKDLTSNNNWQITFKNLPKYDAKTGKEIIYKVTENNVPKGYYNSIKQENNVFTITNSKYGSIKITKVDSGDTSKKLGGAEFKLEKLKEVNGKMEIDKSFATKTATTSSKEAILGKLEFKNLEYGIYKLTETKAPEGYSLSKNSTQIEITPEKTDYVGELSNKEKTTLPLTGGTGRNILIAVGVFFLILLFMIKKKRIYVIRN